MSDKGGPSVLDRVAAIDAEGRQKAEVVNRLIREEGLSGFSPATIKRVEELCESVDDLRDWSFHHVLSAGQAPTVAPARYLGRVRP